MCRCNFLSSNILLIPATPSNKTPPSSTQTHTHTQALASDRDDQKKLMQHRCSGDQSPSLDIVEVSDVSQSGQRLTRWRIPQNRVADWKRSVCSAFTGLLYQSCFLESGCRPGSC